MSEILGPDGRAINGNNGTAAIRAAELQLRALGSSILMERLRLARQHGITFGGLRDEYELFGYDREISNAQYRDEYMRGGVAGRIVDAMPNATWRGTVELIEDEDPETDTQFEQSWKALDTRLQIQAKLLRVDKLAGLSSYAVLLIGAKGDLSTELPKGRLPNVDDPMDAKGGLLYLQPFSGGGGPGVNDRNRSVSIDADCTIQEYETDPQSERFGLPLFYQLRRTDLASPAFGRPVHWTRIIHVAEGLLDDDVFGQPALQRVWNLLADLRKVTGGGAEAFWLRANQGMNLNLDKDSSLGLDDPELVHMKQQAEEYQHQIRRILRTHGVDVKMLSSDVANFANPADAILTQISGAKAIPKRILTGSEMGELASSQDRDNWKDQVNGRQTGYAGPYIVRPLVDRLVKYGYMPTPLKGALAYEVRWPHIEVLTETEKATGASAWASTNATQGEPVFTAEEIRDKWYGMEPLTEEQRGEIEKRNEEKVKQAAEMMKATTPAPDPDEEEGTVAKGKFPRAAESEDEIVRILADAINSGATEVVEEICGLKLGAFNPDQPRDEHGKWTSGGGEFLATPSDAILSLQEKRPATVAREDLRGVLRRAKDSEVAAIDLTRLTIEDTPLFAGGLNRPRNTMPQIPDENRDSFLEELKIKGVEIRQESVDPVSLLPTQNEINAGKVGQMLEQYDAGKHRNLSPILVSKDSYVLDGHHRWALMSAVAFENPPKHIKQDVIRIMTNRDRALRLMLDYDEKLGIARRELRAFDGAWRE